MLYKCWCLFQLSALQFYSIVLLVFFCFAALFPLRLLLYCSPFVCFTPAASARRKHCSKSLVKRSFKIAAGQKRRKTLKDMLGGRLGAQPTGDPATELLSSSLPSAAGRVGVAFP